MPLFIFVVAAVNTTKTRRTKNWDINTIGWIASPQGHDVKTHHVIPEWRNSSSSLSLCLSLTLWCVTKKPKQQQVQKQQQQKTKNKYSYKQKQTNKTKTNQTKHKGHRWWGGGGGGGEGVAGDITEIRVRKCQMCLYNCITSSFAKLVSLPWDTLPLLHTLYVVVPALPTSVQWRPGHPAFETISFKKSTTNVKWFFHHRIWTAAVFHRRLTGSYRRSGTWRPSCFLARGRTSCTDKWLRHLSLSVSVSLSLSLSVSLSLSLSLCSRLLYYLIREIKTWLNINHITVHNNIF